jgi:23S rRNA pseudouridine1911/1915/1917 synthase
VGRHPRDRKRMAVVPGGRRAVTHWRVLETFPAVQLAEATLETGRTHQVRVHLASLRHPWPATAPTGPTPPWPPASASVAPSSTPGASPSPTPPTATGST